ncbi:MAG: TrmB family transcriptional regulator [Methanomicrobiaceae archaeon]|nr:TrmB family transcriptional regulator [Methanomicrobiaceae archaeon]
MIDESLIPELKDLGMSEYEAKVYSMLLALRVASAREIHEITKIPRGRVYETLTVLIEKGYVNSSNENPARYSAADVSRTFDRIKHKRLDFLDKLSEKLQNLEKERSEVLLGAYELRTIWAIDKQIRLIFARAKSEIVILLNDEFFMDKYAADMVKAKKRIPVYPIIEDESFAEKLPLKCYLGDKDVNAAFFRPQQEPEASRIKLIIYSDGRESLLVFDREGIYEGVFLSNHIHAAYISRMILKNITEIKPLKKKKQKK